MKTKEWTTRATEAHRIKVGYRDGFYNYYITPLNQVRECECDNGNLYRFADKEMAAKVKITPPSQSDEYLEEMIETGKVQPVPDLNYI